MKGRGKKEEGEKEEERRGEVKRNREMENGGKMQEVESWIRRMWKEEVNRLENRKV